MASLEGIDVGNLRANVNAHASGAQVTFWRAPAVKLGSVAPGHSELVLVQAGGDVGMSVRGDIGIYAYGEARRLAKMRGAGASNSSSLALSTLNSRMPRRSARSISSAILPTPEKTTFARGFRCGSEHPLQFSAGDDVETRASRASSRRIDRLEFAFTE